MIIIIILSRLLLSSVKSAAAPRCVDEEEATLDKNDASSGEQGLVLHVVYLRLGPPGTGAVYHMPGMTRPHPATVAVAIGGICTVPGVVL